MPKIEDLSRSLVAFKQDSTLVALVEMSLSKWLVGGIVPGLSREPLKKLDADANALLALLKRWREEAEKAGKEIKRVCVAFEAGRDGFWLARWLRQRGIEAYVIHPTSIPVSREHRRAKTDRLDIGLLKRAFLGWLRGEPKHCSMAAIPSVAEEDARRPNRERENLVREATRITNRLKATLARLGIRNFNVKLRKAAERLDQLQTPEGIPLPPHTLAEMRRDMARRRLVLEQIAAIEAERVKRLQQAPTTEPHKMVLLLAGVFGIGIETADQLVQEVFVRKLRDARAVARFVGTTGSPDESGAKRREKGLAKAGNSRLRKTLVQLAWNWSRFQPESALAKWYQERTKDGRGTTRKTMIVALARKLLIALWRYATMGELPAGVVLRPQA